MIGLSSHNSVFGLEDRVIGLLTCVLGDAHQSMLGGCILHDPKRWHEGAAGRNVDNSPTAQVPGPCASGAAARDLLLHDFAGCLNQEKGAFDVDVEKSLEFGNICVCYLGRVLYAELQASKWSVAWSG